MRVGERPRSRASCPQLGFLVSARTLARYWRRLPRGWDPGKRCWTCLHNHRESLVASDFFAVPTITLHMLFGFLVIEHGAPQDSALADHEAPPGSLARTTPVTRYRQGHEPAGPPLACCCSKLLLEEKGV